MTDTVTLRLPLEPSDEYVVDLTVERLCTEFGDRFDRARVAATVRLCARDLAGTPIGALPELRERAARQRLLDASALSVVAAG